MHICRINHLISLTLGILLTPLVLNAGDAVVVNSDGTTKFTYVVSGPNLLGAAAPVAIGGTMVLDATAAGQLYLVAGTTTDYPITLPSAAAIPGAVIGFSVASGGSASRQYTIQAASASEKLDGRASLVLIQSNYLEIVSVGGQWISRVRKIDTDWIDGGAPVLTATSTNPTKGGIARDKLFWRRIGNDLQIRYEFAQTSAGVAGSGTYRIPLPIGAVDGAKIWDQTSVGLAPAIGSAEYNPGTNEYVGVCKWISGGICVVATSGGTLNEFTWGSAGGSLANPVIRMSCSAEVPMLGW